MGTEQKPYFEGQEKTNIVMPKMGESLTEGTVTKWLVKDHTFVSRDEPIFEIATEKVDTEIPSPASGILTIVVPEGTTVPVDAVVGIIIAQAASVTDSGSPIDDFLDMGPLSPLVRRMAREYKIDLRQVKGTGAGGRIMKKDVEAYLAQSDMSEIKNAPTLKRAPDPVSEPSVGQSDPEPAILQLFRSAALSAPAADQRYMPATKGERILTYALTKTIPWEDIINTENPPPSRIKEAEHLQAEINRQPLIRLSFWLPVLPALGLLFPSPHLILFVPAMLFVIFCIIYFNREIDGKIISWQAQILELQKPFPMHKYEDTYRVENTLKSTVSLRIIFELPNICDHQAIHKRLYLILETGLQDLFQRALPPVPNASLIHLTIGILLIKVWHEVDIPVIRWHVMSIETQRTFTEGTYY